MIRQEKPGLAWQSKAILLIVVPWTSLDVLFQSLFWARSAPVVVWTTLGISAAFGLIVWRMRAGTAAAAATGAAITASLMYSTVRYPYATSWLHGGLLPLLAVFLLTYAATKIGKAKKEQLGTAEGKRGRNAAQIAANLGIAAALSPLGATLGEQGISVTPNLVAIIVIAALSEAAADTVSSEIGQVFGGQPRMITTLRLVEPGTDGGITIAGTATGVVAAAIVATIASWAMSEGWLLATYCAAGAMLGLLFDSLLGGTLERRGWLNNDAVNYLSTLSAPIFSILAMVAAFYWFGLRVS